MRFTLLATATLSIFPTLFAAPMPVKTSAVTIRDTQTDNLVAAVSNAQTLGSAVSGIVARIKADPINSLKVYEDDSRTGTYDIPKGLSNAFNTALNGIETLPSLTSSSNPSEEVFADFGPLVKTITVSLFYTAIDLKLLTQDTAGLYVPGYSKFIGDLDVNSFAYVKALDAKYIGFTDALATAVGADTPLGQAIKALGGQTFYLIFDHVSPTG
ncbi:uncharacterized protein IL334_000778 [Kwoniella shivajii]|uniref:FAS1 domain-containing protein n=1 Tax=Kwoniella shivajii TaxID=564305 RepID=A0ABZ1CQK6_9TREE|nr:hypothetical protein IL334_000778 [Kwoniella shivajii]